MTVITISREIGSNGDWIAKEASLRLGYHLVDKQKLERIFINYGFVDFKEIYESSSFWERFDPQMGEMVGLLNRFVQGFAAHGKVVLVGRGGFAMLKNFGDVLNVRIQAPLSTRIDQVMFESNLVDREKATAIVKDSDHTRQKFLENAYGSQWNISDLFDLVIDTGKISSEIAVEMVVDTSIRMENRKSKGQVAAAGLEIDPAIMNTIREIFDEVGEDN